MVHPSFLILFNAAFSCWIMAGGTALPAMHGGGLFPDTLDGKQNLGAVGGVSQAASTVTVALCRSSGTSSVTRRAGAPWLLSAK